LVGYSLVNWIWPKSIFLLLSHSSQTFLACLPACLLACLPFDDWDDGICSFNHSLLAYLVSNCSHISEECFIRCCCCSYLVQNYDESHFLCEWVQSFHFIFFPLVSSIFGN
jgi:hypothetical protein